MTRRNGKATSVKTVKINGEALRDAIYGSGQSVRSLCDSLYYADSTVSKKLTAGEMPSGMLNTICMALDRNPEDFLARKAKTPTPAPKEEPATNGRFDAHIAKLEELRKVNVDAGAVSTEMLKIMREMHSVMLGMNVELIDARKSIQYMSKRMTEQTEKIYNVVKYHSSIKASS